MTIRLYTVDALHAAERAMNMREHVEIFGQKFVVSRIDVTTHPVLVAEVRLIEVRLIDTPRR
jgi:hypothetical protein